jgi:NAD-dependent deacetylase
LTHADISPVTLAVAAEALAAAQSVVVFTGAGISAESGLPTFRSGFNAMWKEADIARYANPRGYRAHAPDSYRWYRMRVQMAASVQPNAGHLAIVDIERRVPVFTLVTQNVDGLHHRAGSRIVIELHGHLRDARVMFEEELAREMLEGARAAAVTCDVLISVGTSNLVWPARELPALAAQSGATVIIVNPDMEGQLSAGERCYQLRGAAGAVLPELIARAWRGLT